MQSPTLRMCPPSTVVLQSAASCHYRWPHSRLHLFKQRAYREMVLCPTTHVILLKASSERRCRVEQYLSKVCCPMRSSSPSGACCTLAFMYPNKKVICIYCSPPSWHAKKAVHHAIGFTSVACPSGASGEIRLKPGFPHMLTQ